MTDDPPIQLPPGFMWCVDIGDGIQHCIPSERLHLTDMSSDGETIKYTLSTHPFPHTTEAP